MGSKSKGGATYIYSGMGGMNGNQYHGELSGIINSVSYLKTLA